MSIADQAALDCREAHGRARLGAEEVTNAPRAPRGTRRPWLIDNQLFLDVLGEQLRLAFACTEIVFAGSLKYLLDRDAKIGTPPTD